MKSITNNRGQVGIGTLIVFIALVLVAAIAAGVLINTAGFLQTQAEETGQDSTDQVADNINVIGEVGDVVEDEDVADAGDPWTEPVVYQTKLTVQRSPGSDDIDLTGLSVQWVGDNGFAQLIHVSDEDDTVENAYLVDEITAESDGDAVLTDDGDRYEIVIPIGVADTDATGSLDNLNDDDTVNGAAGDAATTIFSDDVTDENDGVDNTELEFLAEGDEATLEITTDAGATRNVAISVPDTLIDEEGGTVTL